MGCHLEDGGIFENQLAILNQREEPDLVALSVITTEV